MFLKAGMTPGDYSTATNYWNMCVDGTGTLWIDNRMVSTASQGSLLWDGAYYMTSGHTVTPSRKLSECNNGWILAFSDFNAPNTPNDFDWNYVVIHKYHSYAHNGDGVRIEIPTGSPNFTAQKYLYIYDNKIVGHDDNNQNGADDTVLRHVLAF
jgi:hypothetical protein